MAEAPLKDKGKGGDRGDKKEAKPPVDIGDFWTLVTELAFIVLVLFLVYSVFHKYTAGGSVSFLNQYGIPAMWGDLVNKFTIFTDILSILFAIGIGYSLYRLNELGDKWRASLYDEPVVMQEGRKENDRWQRVVEHLKSDSSSEWRLAILECDIILDDLLDKIGYGGGTIGDKLKASNKGEFRTLDNAWEAHKIRNAIAHEGQDFALSERETKRVVSLYESCFREFDFI